MGKLAVSRVHELIAGKEPDPPVKVMLYTSLVVRQST
jgi:hypothetical protein